MAIRIRKAYCMTREWARENPLDLTTWTDDANRMGLFIFGGRGNEVAERALGTPHTEHPDLLAALKTLFDGVNATKIIPWSTEIHNELDAVLAQGQRKKEGQLIAYVLYIKFCGYVKVWFANPGERLALPYTKDEFGRFLSIMHSVVPAVACFPDYWLPELRNLSSVLFQIILQNSGATETETDKFGDSALAWLNQFKENEKDPEQLDHFTQIITLVELDLKYNLAWFQQSATTIVGVPDDNRRRYIATIELIRATGKELMPLLLQERPFTQNAAAAVEEGGGEKEQPQPHCTALRKCIN